MTRLRMLVVVAALLAGTACQAKPKRVVLGVGLSANNHAAVMLAAREINAAGGIAGVPLQLFGLAEQQNRYDPQVVIRSASRFVGVPELLAVIGHSDSASTLSAAATYNKHGVPQIVTIATNPAITNIGPWTYRLCLSDAAQGPALAEYAVRSWRKRRIAMFVVNDDYGRALSERFEKRARDLGATISEVVMHRNRLEADDEEMIRASLGRMKAEPPDLVVLFQRVAAAIWTLRAMHEAGIEVDKLGGDDLAQESFISREPALTRGIRVSEFYRVDERDPRAAKFRSAFRALAGVDPDSSQAFAYDAVYLFRDALASAGFTRADVRRYLDGLVADGRVVHGVAGPYTLGPDHDARRSMYIAEIRDGRFEVLEPLRP